MNWPQCHVFRGPDWKSATYDTLSLAEFVFGYVAVMDRASAADAKHMLAHLKQLMMDCEHFQWEMVRNFHGVFLQQMEKGLITWASDVSSMRSQYIIAAAQATMYRSRDRRENMAGGNTRYCAEYQTGANENKQDQHSSSQGVVHHVCAYCLRMSKKECKHPETECIRKRQNQSKN